MEEKIEYRLEERTADIQDLLENCQTRVRLDTVKVYTFVLISTIFGKSTIS